MTTKYQIRSMNPYAKHALSSLPKMKFSEKFTTSLFKVKIFDSSIVVGNGIKSVWLVADRWGMKLLLNPYDTRHAFRIWLWKLDCYRLEFRPDSKRSLYVRNFSSRFEIKLQFIDTGARSRFLCQCENLFLIRRFEKKISAPSNNRFGKKSLFKKKKFFHFMTNFFCGCFSIMFSCHYINYYYEPMFSPFEQINL